MNQLIKGMAVFAFLASLCFSQDFPNIQFDDMEGNSYDLYELLNEGKHVYFMTCFNG